MREFTEIRVSAPCKTTDGTPLSKLGLGLGPTTNGVKCLCCKSRGYTTRMKHKDVDCDKCHGSREQPKESPCRACETNGKGCLRKSKKKGPCKACGGTKIFKHPRLKTCCTACNGKGNNASKKEVRIVAIKCRKCDGAGETAILNPAFPRALRQEMRL